MSAPLLWIGIPLAASAVLALLYRRARLVCWAGSLLSAALALIAWQVPIDRAGPAGIQLISRLNILGRSLVLEDADRPLLVYFFLAALIWFAAAQAARGHRMFIPLGLAVLAFLVAALAVEPFLYAALLVVMAVLLSIPFLYPPGTPAGNGVTRYLIFQSLGMPFILFAGWMLTGLEAGSSDLATTLRAGVMLALGFAFLLAVFPFYSWIPLLTSQVEAYSAGFILFIQPAAVLMLGLTFFDRYAWLRNSGTTLLILMVMGTVMIVTGGLWSIFHRHLGRVFGSAVIMETGFSLVAAGLGSAAGYASFVDLLLPRLAGLAVWAFCLAVIQRLAGTLDVNALFGLGRRKPLLVVGVLAAQLSLAGLPLLAGFPVKLAILIQVSQASAQTAVWIVVGMAGSVISALYAAYVYFSPAGQAGSQALPRWPRLLILAGAGALLLMGTIPGVYLQMGRHILQAFPNLPGL